MKQKFQEINLSPNSLKMIDIVNAVIREYQQLGYDLTLRQLYYQLVARDYIPNKQTEYKKIGELVSKGRLAGMIDWGAIVDRTRSLEGLSHWDTPADILNSAEYSYRRDKWSDQQYAFEVWVEKDALRGVISNIANQLDVPHFACRGYSSQSEMYEAGRRILRNMSRGKTTIILHLGDHDPSGIDMTRDIIDRLQMFSGGYHRDDFEILRLALNWDQIEQYNPPPNPAKETDSRFEDYQNKFGDESWELDALNPTIISDLIQEAVEQYRNDELYEAQLRQEEREKLSLRLMRIGYKVENGLHLTAAELVDWKKSRNGKETNHDN